MEFDAPDAIELLKNDHVAIKHLLRKLEDTSEEAVKTRKTLFAEIRRELLAHGAIEEEFLYPAIEEVAEEEMADEVKHSYEEHHVVDVLLDELSRLDVSDEAWAAKVHVMRENLEHHIKEEEEDLFPYARKALGDEELRELGTDMAERREEALIQAEASKDESAQSKPLLDRDGE